jgi:hypothetical protein
MTTRILTVSALLVAAASASAQGYMVRTYGYFDRTPFPPAVGGTWSYTPYRPFVTVLDPRGGLADVPLQPKVLYYDTPFVTPQGLHRPISITVMPDPNPRAYRFVQRGAEPLPPVQPIQPIPEAAPAQPAVKPVPPPPQPMPPAPRAEIPTVPVKPVAPPLPDVPKLPDLPKVPDATPKSDIPKLGPTPMDLPPSRRPPG